MQANTMPASDSGIACAAELMRAGGLVAFPTETVYGLGANATSDSAVAAIFEAKGRPHFNPLIVHVRDVKAAKAHVAFVPLAEELAREYWPGPLTLVLPRNADSKLSLLVSAGLDTVAVRSPAHPVARKLLLAAEVPIAAPSANRSGRVSATTAAHVVSDFGCRVDLVLDGGATELGLESTVIGFEKERAVLLRPGAVPRASIERVAGPLISPAASQVSSPGQLRSHYAPRTPLRLWAGTVEADEGLLAFGPRELAGAQMTCNLSPTGDLRQAAANLFAMLRQLDSACLRQIAVMPIPETGLGEAINDRLRRAAAPQGSE